MAKKKDKIPIPIYQLRITLKDLDPPIIRILQVKGNCNLGKLHHYIQGVMGWANCHLHDFRIKGKRYQDIEEMDDFMDDNDVYNEHKYYLNKLLQERDNFEYEYDFGDSWEHEILVEKIVEPQEGVYYPICIYGERACPPEDSGGTMGYEELLEVLNDPTHEEYEDYIEWAGKEIDPDKFDLDKANDVLGLIKSMLREPMKHW